MSTSVVLRRILTLAMLGVAIALAVAWRRGQPTTPTAPPEWPPLPPRAASPDEPAEPPVVATAVAPAPDDVGSAATVGDTTVAWVAAVRGEAMPDGYPVKVKVSSGIFHVPGGRFYERTMPDRWYATADAAEADGYRRSKS
jgi:hypothetical protein